MDYDEKSLEGLARHLRERGEFICITRKVRRVERLRQALGHGGVEVIDSRDAYFLLRLHAVKEERESDDQAPGD